MNTSRLLQALKTKTGFEKIGEQLAPDRLQLYGRVHGQADRMLLVVHALLQLSERNEGFAFDCSRQYILKGGKLVYRWRLILQMEDIEQHLDKVVAVVSGAATPTVELTEFPLPGADSRRGELKNGRGVQNAGSSVVGPMAMRRS